MAAYFPKRFLFGTLDVQYEGTVVMFLIFKLCLKAQMVLVYGCYTSFPQISATHSSACPESAYKTLRVTNYIRKNLTFS